MTKRNQSELLSDDRCCVVHNRQLSAHEVNRRPGLEAVRDCVYREGVETESGEVGAPFYCAKPAWNEDGFSCRPSSLLRSLRGAPGIGEQAEKVEVRSKTGRGETLVIRNTGVTAPRNGRRG